MTTKTVLMRPQGLRPGRMPLLAPLLRHCPRAESCAGLYGPDSD